LNFSDEFEEIYKCGEDTIIMLSSALRECVEMWMYAGAIGSKSLSSTLSLLLQLH